MNTPFGLIVDSSGNLYIADAANNRIRKVDTSGVISTVAGVGTASYSGDGGAAVAAELNSPKRVALDSSGNLYIADSLNSRIRKIDTSGTISTFAGTGVNGYSGDGGAATAAKLGRASGVAVDSNGNVYIADYGNHRIRKVDTSGMISTVAGTGTGGYSGDGGAATAAKLNSPLSVAVDSAGNLYIVDLSNSRIRKVDTSGNISTVAGTGTSGYSGDGGAATAAQISGPTEMAVDSNGNLYIAEQGNRLIRKVDASGNISTIAGTGVSGYSGDGGDPTAAQLNNPAAVAVDNRGSLYIADSFNHRIRKMGLSYALSFNSNGGSAVNSQAINYNGTGAQPTAPTKAGYTFAGWYRDSGLTNAFDFGSAITGDTTLYAKWTVNKYTLTFNSNSGSTVSSQTLDYNSTAVQPVSPTRASYTFAGWYRDSELTNAFNFSSMITGDTTLYAKWVRLSIDLVAGTTAGYSGDGGAAIAAQMLNPAGMAIDSGGNIYFADLANYRIRKIDTSGTISTVAGTGTGGYSGDGGPATSAQLWIPSGVAVDSSGNLYIVDGNSDIRKVDTSGNISTVVGTGTGGYSGDGGAATAAELFFPQGNIAVGSDGSLYIADTFNHVIRKVDASGTISTVAGTGDSGYSGDGGPATAAKLNMPYSVAIDSSGNLYISDSQNNRIRKVDVTGTISTVAGAGGAGYSGDGGIATAAQLNVPNGVAVDSSGNLYIADSRNLRIRRVDSSGTISTVAGTGAPGNSGDGGAAIAAKLNSPQGVAVDSGGVLYIADTTNNRIRKLGLLYTLSFNSNGGSVVASKDVSGGSAATEPTAPTQTDYQFAGWYSDSGLTHAFDFNSAITGDMTLYAKWATISYTVSFTSNGGSAVTSQTVDINGTAAEPTAPIKTGYTFAGWYSDSDLTNAFNFNGAITGNTTLYAEWTINSYTVSFNSNYGSEVTNQTVTYNTNASEPSVPTREGYTFGGWYRELGFVNAFDFNSAITGDTTLYAKWTIDRYTVSFNSNGGSEVTSQTVTYSLSASEPSVPTRSGYTFGGWYRDSGLATVYDFNSTVAGNTTLYAKWTINSYAVSFAGNGGTEVTNQTVTYNTYASEPVAPTRSGYTFGGWYSESGFATVFDFNSAITGDTTLYAKWTVNSYTVSFTSNGGSEVTSQTVTYNTYASEPIAPTRSGYTFGGWYSESGLATAYDFNSAVTGDTTLYAKWTINSYTVSFTSNGGSVVTSQTVTYNTYASEPIVPKKTGYTFGGWYSDSGLATAFDFNSAIASDTTLYAKWTTNSYTVSFTSNGGSVVASQTVTYNTYASEPVAPTKTGYTFGGWYSDSGFANAYDFNSAITGDTTLYAKWTTNSYTVSFTSNGGAVVASQTVTYNTYASEPIVPTKTGYSFGGWYSESGLATVFDFNSVITGDTTLYAKWAINSYTISFISNGGSVVASQTVTYNTYASEPVAPTKSGYTFGGWYSDSSLANAYDFNSAIAGDTTLYAKWTINSYTVSFTSNGGSVVTSQTVTYNTYASEPAAPTKSGYTFGGWYSESGLATAFDFNSAVTGDTTLYAKWATVPVTGVTLDKNALTLTVGGGTAALTATVLPSNATNKNVTWESSNTSAATVDSSGVVTPVAAGTATILVTTADGSKSATSTVTVNALTSAAVPSIDTQPADQTVNVGGSATLTVSASGGAALSNQWYSSATNSAIGGTPINGATGASYAAPTTVTGTTYYYVVVTNTDSSATGSKTAAAASRVAKVTVNTASPSGPTAAPTGLAANAGNGQVALAWNGVQGTVTYNVYAGTASGAYGSTPIATVSGATYSYTATGLTNGMTYYFAVKANSTEGTSGYSNEVSAKPAAATPVASSNAKLSGLALSSGTLSPAFAEGITSYTASVGNSISSVKVTPSSADSSAVITVNGTTVASGQASSAVALNVGSNPITVSVTAQDGITTQTYTVNVTRAAVINASSGTPIQVTTEPVSITVPSGATNVEVSVATTIVGSTMEATLPLMEVQAATSLGNVGVSIPSGTTITAPANWNGRIKMPQVQSASSVTVSGGSVSFVIEVGAADIPLTFDKAVRLLVPDQGGKSAGYVRNGVFTPITGTITADTQTAADNEIAAGGDAVITVGNDLVIWTKHFTQFAGYTKVASTSTGSTGTSGGHGGAATNSATIAAATGGTATLNGVTIEVPAGAMASSFTMTINQVSDTSSLPVLESALQLASEVYEIKKDMDGDFSKPVVITLPFDKMKIDFTKSTAGVYWLNEQTRKWVQLDNLKVDEAKGTASGSVSHFTKFAVLASDKAKTEEKPGLQTNVTNFSDIQGHWAEANIKQAVSMGIVSGYPDGTFMPDHTVTRAEFAVMLMNVLKPQGNAETLTFTDTAKIGSWAQKSVAQAVHAGIITGYEDSTFRPDAEITRPEMAVMIAKSLGQSVEVTTATGFADDKDIPAWSKGAVATLKTLGIIEGKGADEFAPVAKTTRAEAVSVLLKMLAQKSK
ncbi:InlB B-repeat-containing protein [Paenibacillus thalictri]|uniref:InlB B-repeat-containing protein n=1 Tax=Paenibacillus thalictri TaxID=2527873 RepID=UPI00197F4D1D|nr:InlB B-repeat-containing protein [Paenibacillus thalictri]